MKITGFGVASVRPCRYSSKKESLTIVDPRLVGDTDINVLYRNYVRFGTYYPERLSVPRNQPHFGDFSETDFVSAMNYIARAREQFEALPVEIRERFGYNPRNLLEFLGNKDNIDEAKKLGLMVDVEKPVTLKEINQTLKDNLSSPEKGDKN